MSYRYRGRYTHDYREYQRWIAEGERETLRSTNNSLQSEAGRLRTELNSTREALLQAEGNVRESARLYTILSQRQQELEVVQQRMDEAHRQYEERATRRQQELADEISRVEEQAEHQIEQLQAETSAHLDAVRGEVGEVREGLAAGLSEVRDEIEQTGQRLQRQVEAIRGDLEEERQRRVAKEHSRASQAAATAEMAQTRLSKLNDLDALGLGIERTRTQELLTRTRELLSTDPEMALPSAESAFAATQTAYLESEYRLGVIEGTAEHVDGLAAALEAITAGEHFRIVFRAEAEQIDAAVALLRARAADWRRARHWTSFEVERPRLTLLANDMLARALELEAVVPGLIRQLREREERLKDAGAVMAAITGAVDSFEKGYSNPEDVKSPRLLRGHVGEACVDAYLGLDGTYQIDAYGFTSSGKCGEAATRMCRKLEERWHVTQGVVEQTNRAEPAIAPPPPEETWQRLSRSFSESSQQLSRSGGRV